MSASNQLTPLGGWLHQAEGFLRRFVVLSDDASAAVALWIAHSHAFVAAAATPYLSVSSAEMESGKTRLLEVLRLLVANPWFTGRTTPAALTRKIDKEAPTLLLDEGDPAFNGDKEYAETLRGVLNTGYRKGGAVTVCVGQGTNIGVRDFSSFCPKAIAGIGRLPDTVQSRSIPVRMKKRLASERIERFRELRAEAVGHTIADGLAVNLEPLVEQLAVAEPWLPDELSDRAQDVWEPLLAIADAAGGLWPERARAAAVRLSGRAEPEDASTGVRLLAHIRECFGGRDRLAGAALLDALRGMEEAPWGDWYGKPISAQRLSRLLRPFDIRSRSIWLGSKSAKGFLREQFTDAWKRYLPADPPSEPADRQTGATKPETPDPEPAGRPVPAGFESPEKPHEQAILPVLPVGDAGHEESRAPEASDKPEGAPSYRPICTCETPDEPDDRGRCSRCYGWLDAEGRQRALALAPFDDAEAGR
jgi:hypothetical protein